MIDNRLAFVIKTLSGEFYPFNHFHTAKLFTSRSVAERKIRELDAADKKTGKFVWRDVLPVKIQVDDGKI